MQTDLEMSSRSPMPLAVELLHGAATPAHPRVFVSPDEITAPRLLDNTYSTIVRLLNVIDSTWGGT
jgi:hypothetical protein